MARANKVLVLTRLQRRSSCSKRCHRHRPAWRTPSWPASATKRLSSPARPRNGPRHRAGARRRRRPGHRSLRPQRRRGEGRGRSDPRSGRTGRRGRRRPRRAGRRPRARCAGAQSDRQPARHPRLQRRHLEGRADREHHGQGFRRPVAVNVRAPYFLLQQLLPILGEGSSVVFYPRSARERRSALWRLTPRPRAPSIRWSSISRLLSGRAVFASTPSRRA